MEMRVCFNKFDEMLSLKDLKPSRFQRNQHQKEQIERLAKIMGAHGVRQPIHVSTLTGEICFGHGRWMAAKRNKWKEFPIVYQSFKDETEEYACVQSDNAIASWAELELQKINEDIQNLGPDFDIDLLGIKDFTIDPADKYKEEIEDDVPETPKEPISKLGDLYELGEHRLLCGDSTDKATVERLLNGEKADMVFTDPPYGMNLDTDYSGMKGWHQGKKYEKVKGDHDDFTPELIHCCFQIGCKEMFLWGADYYSEHLPNKNEGSWLVWDKRVDESKDKMYGSGFELCWSNNKHQRRIIRKMWAGFMGDAEASKRMHPTQKPTELIKYIFDEWCDGLVNVVDLFGGSGSTLIACEKTKRKCFMMELDPHYIDVIVSRWCKYTGKTSIKRNGKQMDWEIANK